MIEAQIYKEIENPRMIICLLNGILKGYEFALDNG